MKLAKPVAFIALCYALTAALPAQNILISYTKSDSLFVCNTDTFSIKVQNNQVLTLNGATLTVSLPPGLLYVDGTVSGASQQNVSNLSTPVFALPDIPSNQSLSVKVILKADCAAADALDAGQLFIANLAVTSALGNVQTNTTSIPVETGAIVITGITGQLLEGELEDTLLRTICVKNTRLGKIGRLYFEDSHQAGFEISVAGGNNPMQTTSFFSTLFDGGFFSNTGNGDTWLDLNESVCITERIIITDCGTPALNNLSVLRIGWGCGSEICRFDSAVAQVVIQPSTKVPDLVFEQVWAPPTDYCGNTPAIMGFKIKNVGRAEAKDVFLNMVLTEGLTEAAMRSNSFRVVTINGSTPLFPNVSTPTILPACGLQALREGSFVIPLVPAKDSLWFLFDVLTCVDSCEQVQPAFRGEYFYKKTCPPNGFVSGNALIIPEDGYVVRGKLESFVGSCLETGNSYPFVYKAVSQYLLEDGFWHLSLHLPLGITFDSNCGTLLGNAAPVLLETTPLPDGGQEVHFAWATPFQLDSVAMNLCLHYECDVNINCVGTPAGGGVIFSELCCNVRMADVSYWSPSLSTAPSCAINDCHQKILAIDLSCVPVSDPPGDTTGVDPVVLIPGLRDWWNVYRLNLGYRDQDDNRQADLPLSAPNGPLRRDRFLAGDTLRVEYCGVMDSLVEVDTIRRSIWHEITGSDMLINGNDLFSTQSAQTEFADTSKVRFLGNTVRIRYADGTEATCDWSGLLYSSSKNYFQVVIPNTFPPSPVDDIATEKFGFVFPLDKMFLNGCIPKPFIEKGDSIFIYSDFKLDLNFKPLSSNTPDPPLVGFRTATSTGGKVYAWEEQPHKPLQYSGWKKQVSPNTHSIKPCEPSAEVKRFRYSMRIARENMFPFEVRPLAWISDYRQTVPPGLTLESALMEYLTLQDSVVWVNNLPLPFAETPGYLDLDFSPAFAQPVDEGFTLRNQLKFKPNCHFSLPDSSKQYIETTFFGCLNGDMMTAQDSMKNPIGFYSNTPSLKLITADSVVYAASRIFEINFGLKNNVIPVAPAVWVAVVSPSGLASDFELIQMPQNQPVAGNNGLYNLGNIGSFSTLNFRLRGRNGSCETDSLRVIFGWGCSPISSLTDADCGRDTSMFVINMLRPELELDVLQEPASLTLCDTSDWFEFKIYNAKIGYAYDLEASVKLPDGLTIVPGTCQISYPEGSPWANISNPLMLPSNLFQWSLNDILQSLATNGLPGVDQVLQNAFHIRFKTLAECGFVSNTPILYGTNGIEPCGRPSNLLIKPGAPLNILGLNPSYGVQISLQPVGAPAGACAAQTFSVNLNILGSPSAGDSVYIVLPQGLSLITGSYMPGLNAAAGPPTPNASGFQLPLPLLPGGGAMQFEFDVAFGALAGCNDPIVLAQTRVRSEAFCQSLGAPCEVFVATGEASWALNLEHVQLSANNVDLAILNGALQGSITIVNTGTAAANGATAQLWRDLNGNGILDANDLLLETIQTSATIAPGGAAQWSGVLTGVDTAQLCGLLLVIPASENCACDDQVIPLYDFNLQHTALVFCDLQPVTLGVPAQAGFSYEWGPNSGIACNACASTLFTPDANTPPNSIQTLTLTESSANCTVVHQFEVSFGAFANIAASNEVICAGQSVTLNATPPGAAYVWQGPGITAPNQAVQTLQPSQSGTYQVSITFANGCVASDSLTIEVLKSDTTQISTLVTCAGVPVAVFGVPTTVPGQYQSVLQNTMGCDSILLQTLEVLPGQQTEEERIFCMGDTIQIFDTIISQSGEICRTFESFNGCDSTHCVLVTALEPPVLVPQDTIFGVYGQIITLNGPNGYVTYIWQPAPTPPCVNCPSVSYPADSVGYHEYLLSLGGSDGCLGDLLFKVFIFPPCSADSLHIPNAFTPNGDGANDVFRVVAHEGAEVVSSLEIYDRWGEKVYENLGDSYWDGTIDGQPAPSDVYVYIVRVTCGELVGKRVGDVTLLR